MTAPRQPLPPQVFAKALAHNEAIGGTHYIPYRDAMIAAPLRDLRQAINDLRAMPHPQRKRVMNSVNRALEQTYPEVQAGTASQEMAMQCCQDVALWFANEVVEGRATLEMQ